MTTQNKGKGALLMLWLTSAIWGFAFVAQRSGMEFIGPFTFNGIRFLLGSLSLLPLIFMFKRRKKTDNKTSKLFSGGLLAGLVLFIAASLQQAGMVETSAGKAGFITGFYIVLVPVIGIFLKQRLGKHTWAGILVALAGLYFLTVQGRFRLQQGDFLILLSALFWAVHVQLINRLVTFNNPIRLSAMQFGVCGALSIITALFTETTEMNSIMMAGIPLLYGGLMSVGIAYTLQVVAQKYVHPTHASVILSFETVFAVLGGWMILNESLSFRNLSGCLLMLCGILLVQLKGKKERLA